MDTRVFSDGNVDVILIRKNQLTNPHAPAVDELNTYGVNVSNSIAWEGTTWPTNTDSNTTDDRSIKDAGNAVSRGYSQFEATLSFFYPVEGSSPDFQATFDLFKDAADRTEWYIVTRILQTTTHQITPVVAGDLLSVFSVMTDAFITDTEGEDSYKYSINFLPQGDQAIYTQAVGDDPEQVVVTNPTGETTLTVGGPSLALRATLQGHRITNQATWNTSDITVASVSPNGVVTALAAGTAAITATHDAGTESDPVTITVDGS